MQKLYPILLLLGAALCFYAGYKIGQKKPRTIFRENPVVVESAPEPPSKTMEPSTPSSPTVEVRSAVTEPSESAADSFESRARQSLITFTDATGRTLVAEILEVEATGLKIRREADRRVLTLPVDMLSEEDQAFTAYLWERQQANDRSKLSDEETLRRLFENF